jgi:hypothetical protein
MGVVQDMLALQAKLAEERSTYEPQWRDCVEVGMPFASARYDFSGTSVASSMTGLARQPRAVERSRELYDSTAVWACERLTAGMESLITPRAQKWQAFGLDDPFGTEPSDIEEEWLDRLRDYHFAVRYDPRTNFALANQKAIRSTTILGTGVLYSEENTGRRGVDQVRVPFFYRHVPLIECYLGIDAFDEVDTCCRVVEMTAAAAAGYFGEENLHSTLKSILSSAAKGQERFTFMHVVLPRATLGEEYKSRRTGQPFAEFWIDVAHSHLISHKGFYRFPYHVEWWDQTDNSPYGQSPLMSIMSDIKMLQAMSKTALQAAQQMVKPPLASMAGLYNQRLNLNPGAVNPGYMDEQGRMKVQPIITAQNPSFAENLMELKRQGVRESLYVNLFQVLVQNPQQTATEAIIRANEKGELLGPAGAKIEAGIAKAVDMEVEIVQRKGAFASGSPLRPPESMAGRQLGVRFVGPLARLRRMQELQGVEGVLQVASVVGQYDPSVLERIDGDETLEIAREIRGAPRKMFRTDEEVAERRQAAAQRQEQMAALQAAEQIGKTAGAATPALQALQQANAA